MIPEKHAVICWNDAQGKTTEFLVYDERFGSRHKDKFENTRGGIKSELYWMDDPRSTPEGVYLSIIENEPFASTELHIEALDHITKIDNQKWARDLADALTQELKAEKQ